MFFKNHYWQVCEIKGKMHLLPIHFDPSVYMIVVYKNVTTDRKILYIGSSKLLYGRIYSHPIIRAVKRNLKDYTLEVWHKSFGDYKRNYIEENKLIWEIKPPFNLSCSNGKLADNSYEFWRSVGLTKLIGNWDRVYPIKNQNICTENWECPVIHN